MPTPVFTAPERPDVAARAGDPRVPLDPQVVRNLGAKLSAREIERAEDDIDYLGIMSDAAARTSPAIFDAAIGSLGVLGYGRTWLARKLGLPTASLAPGQQRILPYRMRLALTAAIRIGSRWATPESTGQTLQQIEDAQAQALRFGFRVPAAYSDRYVPEAEVALPKSKASTPSPDALSPDDLAVIKIRALAYFCAYGGSEKGLARQFGLSSRTIGRTRTETIGLQVVTGETPTRVAPGQDDLVKAIYRAADALRVEEPSAVWKRLRAFATERMERQAAGQAAAAEAPVAAWRADPSTQRKDMAA